MSVRHEFAASIALVALAAVLQLAPLPAGWIEGTYANGIYATLERTCVPLANRLPFTLGDVLLLALAVGLLVGGVTIARRPEPRARRWGRLAARGTATIALIAIWFNLAWALNYRRDPIIDRVVFDAARVDPRGVHALATRIVTQLDATAPQAHAERISEAQLEATLAQAYAPVMRRLGDRYAIILSRPKTTLFDRWFELAGIGGTWDPFAYETILNAEFLPFERPFALAHEWGHVGGFGNEGDANLIAALTTLRSRDPLIRYSGLFWAFGFLPEDDRRTAALSPLVRADLDAAEHRFLRWYNPRLFSFQWFVYDKYLRANRVERGVVSYSQFVQMLVGMTLDADGLPVTRSPLK
jgi:hypothetical protein